MNMRVAKFTKPLTVGLELEVYAQIQRITDEQKISMAEWIRDAIETTLRNVAEDGGTGHDE
jgi:hypothetical protein